MAEPTLTSLMERVRTLEQLLGVALAELDVRNPGLLVQIGAPIDALEDTGAELAGVSTHRLNKLLGAAQRRRDAIHRRRGV